MGLAFLARSGLQKTKSLFSVSTNILRLLSKVRSDSFSPNSKISSGVITMSGSVFFITSTDVAGICVSLPGHCVSNQF